MISQQTLMDSKDVDGMLLTYSKTDPFQIGVNIQIAPSSSPLCPVMALTLLFTSFPAASALRPLFVRSYGQPFAKQFAALSIRHLLLRAGIPTIGFSGRLIRKDATVITIHNGVSRDDIKLLGRWKSDAVDSYINELAESDFIQKLLHLNFKLLNSNPSYPRFSGASESSVNIRLSHKIPHMVCRDSHDGCDLGNENN